MAHAVSGLLLPQLSASLAGQLVVPNVNRKCHFCNVLYDLRAWFKLTLDAIAHGKHFRQSAAPEVDVPDTEVEGRVAVGHERHVHGGRALPEGPITYDTPRAD